MRYGEDLKKNNTAFAIKIYILSWKRQYGWNTYKQHINKQMDLVPKGLIFSIFLKMNCDQVFKDCRCKLI